MEEQKPTSPAPVTAPKRGTGVWVVVVIVVAILAFAAGLALGPTVFPPAAQRTPLVIGTVLPLTGGLQAYGPDAQKGAQMAVQEINAQGGVLGQPIQLYTSDSQTLASAGRDAATALIQNQHVAAIVGAMGSGISAAVLQVCVPNNVVEVSPASTSPLFTNATLTGGWFFRTVPSDALQGVVAAHYAYTNRSFRTMAVIGINNPYGNGLANVFANSFKALGGTVTTVEIVPEAQTSYTSYLTDVFSKGSVDGIYFVAYPDTGLQLMSDWWNNRAAWPTQWIFSEGLQAQSFIDDMVTKGIDVSGFQGSAPVSPSGPLYNAFAARFQTAYGHAPGLFASNSYDAVYMIALAAQKAGATDGPSIKAQMIAISGGSAATGTKVYPGPGNWTAALGVSGTVNYEGASGSLNWNSFGDPTSSYEVWGMDTSNQIMQVAFFPEAQVIAWTSS